ncbi:hypothetical protein I4U23_020299 [Adineta vaga]|nr:hypothetical protein I4U23_020299 [Adineta vaga]
MTDNVHKMLLELTTLMNAHENHQDNTLSNYLHFRQLNVEILNILQRNYRNGLWKQDRIRQLVRAIIF